MSEVFIITAPRACRVAVFNKLNSQTGRDGNTKAPSDSQLQTPRTLETWACIAAQSYFLPY